MKIMIIIVALAIVLVTVTFVLGLLLTLASCEEVYREDDDRDQEKFIRRWLEKDTKKHGRRSVRR